MKELTAKLYIALRDFIYVKMPGLYIRLHLLHMWLEGADKYSRWLEKGDFYLRRGTYFQIGQPIRFTHPRKHVKYIKGLYYDFGKKKVSALYSHKPIKGKSEPFLKK